MASKNEFKAPKKLADGRRPDLREYCEVFKMTASDESEMEFLSHLYRVLRLTGGTVTLTDDEGAVVYDFRETSR